MRVVVVNGFKILPPVFVSICIFVMLLAACSHSDNADFESEIAADSTDVMPKELWIADAENWTKSDLPQKKEEYTLYATLPDSDQEIEMHFDADRRLFQIVLLNDPMFTQNLYCEDGRIVFSNHTYKLDGSQWMAAYANGKAYASAQKTATDWKSCRMAETPIDFASVYNALKATRDFQKKELNHAYHSRFLDNQDKITATFNEEISFSFSLNVRKGDKIHIDLSDDSKDVYFIVEPNNGSNMEHSSWDGIAEKTGDMSIIVYAVNAAPGTQFTLKAEATSPQTQEFAQAQKAV